MKNVTFLDSMLDKRAITWEILCQPFAKDTDRSYPVCVQEKPTISLLKGFLDPKQTIDLSWKNNFKTLGENSIVGGLTKAVSSFWDVGRAAKIGKDAANIDSLLDAVTEKTRGTNYEMLGTAAKAINKAVDQPFSFLSVLDGKDGGMFKDMQKVSLGSALVNGLDKVPYFSGVECSVGIPTITLRYYHRMNGEDTCLDIVRKLNERFMGKTLNAVKYFGNPKNGSQNRGSVFATIAPPNGFSTAEVGNVNYNGYLPGTFLLRLGRLELPNLLCEDLEYKFSQQKVMKYDGGIPVVTNDYLFVDISVKLSPAVVYTSETIENILSYNSTLGLQNMDKSGLRKLAEETIAKIR